MRVCLGALVRASAGVCKSVWHANRTRQAHVAPNLKMEMMIGRCGADANDGGDGSIVCNGSTFVEGGAEPSRESSIKRLRRADNPPRTLKRSIVNALTHILTHMRAHVASNQR